MISVAVYHKSVPSKTNQEKVDILRNFSMGVTAVGDFCQDVNDYMYKNTHVGVIQGWVSGPSNQHHAMLRHSVIQNQLRRYRYVVSADSNLFLYADTNNPQHYLRYSFNGVFPDTGIYCDDRPDPERWKRISKNLNIRLKDYRTNGDHILLCLQRNGGWSMGSVDIQDWANYAITEIRKYSDRPIVVRLHPGDKKSRSIIVPRGDRCRIKFSKALTLSTNGNLLDDLKNCWAAVNYNSSPVVGAAIEGIPVFVTDPAKSQCADIANFDLSQIESPQMPDRQAWVERLAMSHWNFDELQSGECWRHMRQYVKV